MSRHSSEFDSFADGLFATVLPLLERVMRSRDPKLQALRGLFRTFKQPLTQTPGWRGQEWQIIISEGMKLVVQSDEYRAAARSLQERYPEVMEKVGSSGGSGTTIQAQGVVRVIVETALHDRIVEGRPFTECWPPLKADLEDLFEKRIVRHESAIPIIGLKFPARALKITDSISICPVDRRFLYALGDLGFPFRAYGTSYVPTHKISVAFNADFTSGQSGMKTAEEFWKREAEANEAAQLVELALMFHTGRVFYTPARIRRSLNLLFGVGTSYSWGHLPSRLWYPDQRRITRLRDEVQTTFERIAELNRRNPGSALLVAVRRLRDCLLRENEIDTFLDVMIAAEALFLADAKGELSFRFSQRAAFLLGTSPAQRAAILDRYRVAYDVRSKIVHGDQPPKSRIKLAGEEVSLNRFTNIIFNDLLRASERFLERGMPTAGDWQGLLVGSLGPRHFPAGDAA